MPRLIILRGPMGSGKSTIAGYLRKALQDSGKLDLDWNADGEVCHLDQALGKRNVIAEMYDGGSHTRNPEWIAEFRDRKYDILSVILHSNLGTSVRRVLHRPGKDVRYHYQKFHNELGPIFSIKAGVREKTVSTEDRTIEEVGQEILDLIQHL